MPKPCGFNVTLSLNLAYEKKMGRYIVDTISLKVREYN